MPEKTSKKQQQPIDNTYGHIPPQALDIERVVLGALMIDKDAFSVVSDKLRPETFYEPRHQKIYHAIQMLSIEDKPVDIMTVTEQLRREGTLETVGGPEYIIELSADVASSAHIEYHSDILTQKFLGRQLISFASQIETKAYDETIDVEELMQEAEGALFEISQKNMRNDYTQINPVVDEAIRILQSSAASTSGLTGIASGFKRLDQITAGWQKSDLVIIAGRPAMGKTSFALSIAKNIAVDEKTPIAFFSLEMNNVQLVNRLISNICEITGDKILSGQLSEDEWIRLDKNVSKLKEAPLYVDDTAGLSVFELRTKARRLVREKGVKIIMIDYLQLMNASGMRFGNRQEEVSHISRSLKGLAKELDIPILALSQLNRSVDNRDPRDSQTKRPLLSDLRESGAIEQDADMVLFVHRPEYYKIYEDENGENLRGKAIIIIAKHRKGSIGDVVLDFRGQYTRFQNPEDSDILTSPTEGGEILSSKMNDSDDPFDRDEFGGEPDF